MEKPRGHYATLSYATVDPETLILTKPEAFAQARLSTCIPLISLKKIYNPHHTFSPLPTELPY